MKSFKFFFFYLTSYICVYIFWEGAACVRRPVLCGTYSNFVMSPLSWLRVVETPFEVVVEALKLNVGKALGLDGMMITFS